MNLTCSVNNHPTTLEVAGHESTTEVLRNQLDLTGTKLSCGGGVCGTCTIHVDGKSVASCLLPATSLEGKEVRTIECHADELHPLQRAMAQHDALQCGFCTPGFVMGGIAFCNRWRKDNGTTRPDRHTIADAMAGHLCRCGAYPSIYKAIGDTCEGLFDGPDFTPARVDSIDKLTGAARFTVDVSLPDQMEGFIVRSPHAHASVKEVNIDKLKKLADVFTYSMTPKDGIARYVGHPIVAVAAPTIAEAKAAAEMIEITYEVRDSMCSFEDGIAGHGAVVLSGKATSQAPNVAEGPIAPGRWTGNLRSSVGKGYRGGKAIKMIDKARESSSERLVELSFATESQLHSCLEPHASVAHWTGERLHLHVSSQALEHLSHVVSKAFEIDHDVVSVKAQHIGGGFGSKVGISHDTEAAVGLSLKAKRPVRVVLDRMDELTSTGYRPASRTTVALLANEDDTLAAKQIESYSDTGVGVNSAVAQLGLFMYKRTPKAVRDIDVVTNYPPARPFRGPGGAQFHWAEELAVDAMAEQLGIDALELRKKWDGNPKRLALYDWASGLDIWKNRTAAGSDKGRFRRGVGVSAANWIYFADPDVQVEVALDAGRITVSCGVQDMGTGIRTVMRDAVQQIIPVSGDAIDIRLGDSTLPRGIMSAGSRTTTSLAPATEMAAISLRDQIAKSFAGAKNLGSATTSADGIAHDAGTVPWPEVIESVGSFKATGSRNRDSKRWLTPMKVADSKVGHGLSGAVHVTEIEVDTRLGKTRALSVHGGIAVGRIWNRRLATSQAEGSVVQGVSFALYENRVIDTVSGVNLTSNLEDYRMMALGDCPEINIHFHEEGWDHVPGGGVGVGEVGTIGVAASVGNAMYNATGWRATALPMRPDRVLEGLHRGAE